jgi:UPF0755 protein
MSSELQTFFKVFLYIFAPSLAAFLTYFFLSRAFFTPMNEDDNAIKLVEIHEGTLQQVSRQLKDVGVVRSSRALATLAKMQKPNLTIKPGEYALQASMTPKEVLDVLEKGEVFQRKISLPEGISIYDIGEFVVAAGLLERPEDFTAAATDPRLLVQAGISSSSFEGYLAPGDYSFSRPVAPSSIVWEMMEAGEALWTEELEAAKNERGMTRHEILTIASIIQRDARLTDYGRYSAVIHNRLAQALRLQSEATVRYFGSAAEGAELTEEDYNNPHPYNTFVNFGLPPGPISNPGIEAIIAAAFPAETNDLFAVKKPDGTMEFAVNQAEILDSLTVPLPVDPSVVEDFADMVEAY